MYCCKCWGWAASFLASEVLDTGVWRRTGGMYDADAVNAMWAITRHARHVAQPVRWWGGRWFRMSGWRTPSASCMTRTCATRKGAGGQGRTEGPALARWRHKEKEIRARGGALVACHRCRRDATGWLPSETSLLGNIPRRRGACGRRQLHIKNGFGKVQACGRGPPHDSVQYEQRSTSSAQSPSSKTQDARGAPVSVTNQWSVVSGRRQPSTPTEALPNSCDGPIGTPLAPPTGGGGGGGSAPQARFVG